MDSEKYRQLEEGYEAALDAIPELADTLAEAEENMVDILSELTGELQSLTSALKLCLKTLHQGMAAEEM